MLADPLASPRTVTRPDPPPDFETMAGLLAALAYPVRLQLLEALRFPHTLSELKVAPLRAREDGSSPGIMARQTVQGHLDKLVDCGLVSVEPVRRAGRDVPQYKVSPTRLYALIEELRRLSVMYATYGGDGEPTGTILATLEADRVQGPRLVLAHGVHEGKAFRLDDARADPEGWLVGRERGIAVDLEYDPFVSARTAAISRARGKYRITDLGSKNGTYVNWTPLGTGQTRDLRAGDMIRVGRSLLCFIPE